MSLEKNREKRKLITVIVPVYNAEKYIKKCVESICSQSYSELEILLINDGSTDKSREICERYSEQDDRIRIINKDNEGAAAAKNTGIDEANGELLTFVDSDDYIDTEMLEKMAGKLEAESADICICNFIREGTDGVPYENDSQMLHFGDKCFSGYEMLELLNGNLWWRLCQPCTKLYRKELFFDIRFPRQVVEDLAIMHLLYDKCGKVCFEEKAFYHYVQQNTSVLHTRQTAVALDAVKIFEDRILYYEKRGYDALIPGTELLLYDKFQSSGALVNLKDRAERDRFSQLSKIYRKVLKITQKYKRFSCPEWSKREIMINFPKLYQWYLIMVGKRKGKNEF